MLFFKSISIIKNVSLANTTQIKLCGYRVAHDRTKWYWDVARLGLVPTKRRRLNKEPARYNAPRCVGTRSER